jgi:hypothetical protein
MAAGVGKHRDELRETKDGIGKAMCQDDGKGIGASTAFVDEVNAQSSLEFDAKICKAIERVFVRAPVESRLPLRRQLAHVGNAQPVLPARIPHVVDPARALETLLQVVENFLTHRNPKCLNGHE